MLLIIKKVISGVSALLILLLNLGGFTGEKATGHEDYRTYKNVILMIGDGMGFNTVEAAKKYKNASISMETMPVLCQSETRSFTSKVTDSAAGGTALATGIRTYNGAIGVYPFAPLANFFNVPKSLCQLAKDNGKAAGVVTTDDTSGATPAAFSANSFVRAFEPDISFDQMRSGYDLIWGSKSNSVSEKVCNYYGFDYISTLTEMNALTPGTRSFGQFDYGAFSGVNHDNDTPYLSEMTAKAIDLLSADEDGFFLMVEAAHIDKYSHKNEMDGATAQVVEFSNAVQAALDFAKKDGNTLVVVTADHETGGITLDEQTGEFYYTNGGHTGVNVPVYVSASDAGFVTGEAYKNCEISAQLARVMGYDKEQFPVPRG